MLGRELLLVLLVATYGLANPIGRSEDATVADPPTEPAAKSGESVQQVEEVVADAVTSDKEDSVVIPDASRDAADQVSAVEQAEIILPATVDKKVEDEPSDSQTLSEEPVELQQIESIPAVETPVVEQVSVTSEDVVALRKEEEEETSKATPIEDASSGIEESIAIVTEQQDTELSTEQPATDSTVDDEQESVTEQVPSIQARMGKIEETTVVDIADAEETTDLPYSETTEETSDDDSGTATDEPISLQFRNAELEDDEVTTDKEELVYTTEISDPSLDGESVSQDEDSQSLRTDSPVERVDSATDIYYADVTTEQEVEGTTIIPEELIASESIVQEIKSELEPKENSQRSDLSPSEIEEATTVVPEVSDTEVDASEPTVKDAEAQESFTEIPVPSTAAIKDESYEDAAPIEVVEIPQKESSVGSILPKDSAPIEIVEIAEIESSTKDQEQSVVIPVEESKLPTVVEDDAVDESATAAEEKPIIKDRVESPSEEALIPSKKDKEIPVASKVKPTVIDDEYWLKMQQKDAEKLVEAVASPAEIPIAAPVSESKDEAISETSDKEVQKQVVEESRLDEPEIKQESTLSSEVSETVDDVKEQIKIDDQLDKVAQKYGLKPVVKVSSEILASSDDASDSLVVADADVPKKDSLYYESESKDHFQESNDLQRRLSFGDKVVRLVRNLW